MELPRGQVPAPEIGRVWINSPELTLAGLRGRVVLIDFWDYTCVNCLRSLPYLLEWDKRYRDNGLTIIGVHAPEFSFARNADLVRQAVQDHGIQYPVVLDNDFQIWRAFQNRYWPAKYLIDKEGFVAYAHFGEGAYPETEAVIQELLKEVNPALALPSLVPPLKEEDQPGRVCYPVSPELYLGHQRGRLGNQEGFQRDQPADYHLPKEPPPDAFSLGGRWLCRPEFLETAPPNGREPGRILVPYLGKEVNLVMAPNQAGEHHVRLRQDGRPLAREDAGADVEFESSGEAYVSVRLPRMYRLIQNARLGPHCLELAAHQPGLAMYAFTFVSCAAD
ncbi:MAG: redoxin domain-containing protein [Terriglobia bacterium]